MEEYVPEVIPIKRAKTKYLILLPPKIKRANKVVITVRDVAIDLFKVSTIE